MKHTFAVEVRESEPGRRPRLYGTMIREGRAASGGRAELFAPGSVLWPTEGVGIQTKHHGPVEVRAQPVRERDGRIEVRADATDGIRAAIAAGRKWLSVEFVAIRERTTKGGVREVLEAFVPRAALVSSPEYGDSTAELRSKKRRRVWL